MFFFQIGTFEPFSIHGRSAHHLSIVLLSFYLPFSLFPYFHSPFLYLLHFILDPCAKTNVPIKKKLIRGSMLQIPKLKTSIESKEAQGAYIDDKEAGAHHNVKQKASNHTMSFNEK